MYDCFLTIISFDSVLRNSESVIVKKEQLLHSNKVCCELINDQPLQHNFL